MSLPTQRFILPLCASLIFAVAPGQDARAAGEDASLHAKIDRLTIGSGPASASNPAPDEEFLRRASIDLIGMPPSVEELRAFLADRSPDKRTKAIERLTRDPLFDRHLATTLNVMLMERRPNTNISEDEWRDYLLASIRADKPINELFREIMVADGSDPKLRPAVRFYLDRGAEPNLITRDVGRIFFGRDMQCAQCHDHPLIQDYRQTDYHGLLAFLNPSLSVTVKENGKDKVIFAEKAGGSLTFDSVFVKNDKHVTGPRVPGEPEANEPAVPPGQEYAVRPIAGVRPVPKISRRAELASLATTGSNRAFNENVANRLWSIVMGRGLVHPPDLHHPGNPATNPALMKLLGEEIVAMKFDARAFLKELALTKVYQQAFDLRPEALAAKGNLEEALSNLRTETESRKGEAEAAAKLYAAAVKAWYDAETLMIPVLAEQDKAEAKVEEVFKKRDPAEKAVMDVKAQIESKQGTAKSLAEAGAKAIEAAKLLPAEKELAAAAQKFVDRSAALKTEVVGLEKSVVEKTAALKKFDEELAVVAKVVEAARAKVKPLRDAVRAKDEAALAARRKAAAANTAYESSRKRLASMETLARVKSVQAKIVAAEKAVASRREALAVAQKQATEFTGTLMQKQNAVAAAETSKQAADAAKAKAQAMLDQQAGTYESVVAAQVASESALKRIAGDPVLTEVGRKLKEKSEALKAGLAKPTSDRDAASAEALKATQAAETAKQALAVALAEKSKRDRTAGEALAALTGEESAAKTLQTELTSELADLQQDWSNSFALAQLKPLSPEQLCWSMLKVTGILDNQRRAEEAQLDKTKPLSEADKKNPAALKARALEVERLVFDKLKGNVPAFVSIYAAAAGQPQNDFFATADQALFAANGGTLNGWAGPSGSNVTSRMIAEKDLKKAAEDLYLTVFSRSPNADEVADVVKLLSVPDKEKQAAAQELVWGLLTSTEFRFNH